MLSISPSDITVQKLHHYLLGSVGPRPIALASTIDLNGNKNLAPFSFFNVFSANPPILIFSPARSGRTNSVKDTYTNAKAHPEVVINVVTYAMVEQVSLASSPYAPGISEFEKAGLTPLASELVKPFRVKESPVQFECKVNEVIELGSEGGAGNLIICEVVRMHMRLYWMTINKLMPIKSTWFPAWEEIGIVVPTRTVCLKLKNQSPPVELGMMHFHLTY